MSTLVSFSTETFMQYCGRTREIPQGLASSIFESLLTLFQYQGQGGRYGQSNPYAQQNDQYEPAGGYDAQQGSYDQQQPAYGQQQGAHGQQGGYGQQQPSYGQAQGGYAPQHAGDAGRPEAQAYPSGNYAEEPANNTYGTMIHLRKSDR